MTDDRWQEVFRKLDDLKDDFNNFRVEVTKPISKHEEAIRGLRVRISFLTTLEVGIILSITGLAFKAFVS